MLTSLSSFFSCCGPCFVTKVNKVTMAVQYLVEDCVDLHALDDTGTFSVQLFPPADKRTLLREFAFNQLTR